MCWEWVGLFLSPLPTLLALAPALALHTTDKLDISKLSFREGSILIILVTLSP